MNTPVQKPHILVVEDHSIFRRFLLSWLSRWYRVTAVSNGFDALRWLQEGNQTDTILLDMQMPRLSGLQFLRNIRSSGMFASIPVVGITSTLTQEVKARCADFNVLEVFPKPYQPETLLGAINAAIGHNQSDLMAA